MRPWAKAFAMCFWTIISILTTPAKNHAHVIIRQGFDSLEEASELEEDLLDQAWGLEADSRLSCQALVGEEDLVVEIPKYTINHAREH